MNTIPRPWFRPPCGRIATNKATSFWSRSVPDIDPVTREILQHALAAAADEMALALYRTAYSTIVRDCLDYSTSLCNADGEMIAQGVTIPLHLGPVTCSSGVADRSAYTERWMRA